MERKNATNKDFASCHNHSCFLDAEYASEKLCNLEKGLAHGEIYACFYEMSGNLEEVFMKTYGGRLG